MYAKEEGKRWKAENVTKFIFFCWLRSSAFPPSAQPLFATPQCPEYCHAGALYFQCFWASPHQGHQFCLLAPDPPCFSYITIPLLVAFASPEV